jgi:hypothetical protein
MVEVTWVWARRGTHGDRWYYCEGDGTPGMAISWTAREQKYLRHFATKEEARESVRRFLRSWRHMGYRRRDFVLIKFTRKRAFRSMSEVDKTYFPSVPSAALK